MSDALAIAGVVIALLAATVSVGAAVSSARSAAQTRAVNVLGARRVTWATYLEAIVTLQDARALLVARSRRLTDHGAARWPGGGQDDAELQELSAKSAAALARLKQVAPTVPDLDPTVKAQIVGRLDSTALDGARRAAEDELARIDRELDALGQHRRWRVR